MCQQETLTETMSFFKLVISCGPEATETIVWTS